VHREPWVYKVSQVPKDFKEQQETAEIVARPDYRHRSSVSDLSEVIVEKPIWISL
jgi:hypothetical protein